jgi:DNA-binding transcriptional MerR regulator
METTKVPETLVGTETAAAGYPRFPDMAVRKPSATPRAERPAGTARAAARQVGGASGRATPATDRAFSSREAELVTGVPFFTIDYWGRTRFLMPTVDRGSGRGRGRQRLYSYGDLVRIRIARDLREQRVSLASLRSILAKLAAVDRQLAGTRFVMVTEGVEMARDLAELGKLLRRSQPMFGILLDLRDLLQKVRRGVAQLPRPD